ncbi:Polypeptide N-acetylgalactosaminyltransferase 13 [Manis javanica]|nr:Polypeptide N-acetylgalactosaminyltransferase 13 [Manis javanica]
MDPYALPGRIPKHQEGPGPWGKCRLTPKSVSSVWRNQDALPAGEGLTDRVATAGRTPAKRRNSWPGDCNHTPSWSPCRASCCPPWPPGDPVSL